MAELSSLLKSSTKALRADGGLVGMASSAHFPLTAAADINSTPVFLHQGGQLVQKMSIHTKKE
jgi:hypothetical protein